MAIAGATGYLNGVADAGATTPADINLEIYIGCRNAIGTPSVFFTGTISAVAIYSSALSAPQIAAVSAAMSLL
jgi:hypothetical protein